MLIRSRSRHCYAYCVFKDTKQERKGQERPVYTPSVHCATKLCAIVTAIKRLIVLSFHVSDKKNTKKLL